jgi:hypothetical protein
MKIQPSNPTAFILSALFIILCIAETTGCKPSVKNDKEIIVETKNDSEKISEIKELNIADTGQVYFKVNITQNNQPYINYEGDYPVGSRFDSNFTIQLCASKHILEVSDMLNIDIYIKGITTGNFPVMVNSEQGKSTMNMTPLKGNSFAPGEGIVTITKYNDSLISGKFAAKGMDYDSNKLLVRGVFLNLKYNNYIKK